MKSRQAKARLRKLGANNMIQGKSFLKRDARVKRTNRANRQFYSLPVRMTQSSLPPAEEMSAYLKANAPIFAAYFAYRKPKNAFRTVWMRKWCSGHTNNGIMKRRVSSHVWNGEKEASGRLGKVLIVRMSREQISGLHGREKNTRSL